MYVARGIPLLCSLTKSLNKINLYFLFFLGIKILILCYNMRRAESYSRSSVNSNSNNQPYKIPNAVRSTFLNRESFKSEPEDFSINNIVKKSIFMAVLCKLCELKVARDEMIQWNDCNHYFCNQCTHQYITYKLNVMEELVCPQQNCNMLIDTNSISFTNLSQQYKNKYKKLQVWKQTINNPNLRLCPEQKCNGIIDMRDNIYTCQQCKIIYCPECMLKKHEGPCDKNFQQNFLDWKRCPACNMFIQRNEGCNHMTCRCGHQFCYICLLNWTQQHYQCGQQNQGLFNQGRFNPINQAFIQEMPAYQRILLGILMIILFPVVIVLGIIAFAVALGVAIIFSILCGGCMASQGLCQQCCCGCIVAIMFCPFITLGVLIGLVIKLLVEAAILAIQILKTYFTIICNFFSLDRHHQDPDIELFV